MSMSVLLVNPRRFAREQLIRDAVTNIRTLLPWRSVLVLAYLLAATWSLRADQTVSLGWRASPDSRTTGYTVVYGNASGAYTQSTNVGNVTQAAIAGLAQGQTYYFAVYAYSGVALESELSNEVSCQIPSAPAATVVSRLIFYNNSAWDGPDAAANVQDDAAIATDKEALLPGGIATFKNYTSYSRGINGIIVDIAGLGGTPAVDDFTYKAGNDDNPATWASAPPPSSITVRPGAGAGGADRVTLIWPDNAVQKSWLVVTVLATENTQLANPDVFYFGNAIGESGNRTDDAKVDPADELRARANQRTLLDPAPIDFPYDYNRDKRGGPADQLIARANQTVLLNSLRLIDLSASGLSGLATTLSSTGTKQLSPAAFSAGTQTQSSPTPTAPAPSRLTTGLDGQGRLVLAYVSDADQPWQLQSTEGVSDDAWTDADLPEPTLHGTVRRWVLAIEEGESQRFYRMISIPPSMQKGIAQ